MEFVVNENGCRQLSEDMATNLREIARLVSEIVSQDGTLKAALGDDYDAIAESVRIMTADRMRVSISFVLVSNNTTVYIQSLKKLCIELIAKWKMPRVCSEAQNLNMRQPEEAQRLRKTKRLKTPHCRKCSGSKKCAPMPPNNMPKHPPPIREPPAI